MFRPRIDRLLRWLAKRWIESRPKPDLTGDRTLERGFIASHLPPGAEGQTCLDFGCGASPVLSPLAGLSGYQVTAIDLLEARPDVVLDNVRYLRGDIMDAPLVEQSFDVIVCCSTIEHVGLGGRYGVADDEDGADLTAMRRLRALLKADGRLILTLPVGQDAVFNPYHRVYGQDRLPRLLDGFRKLVSDYWVKQLDRSGNSYFRSDREHALSMPGSAHYYGIGMFVLALD